MLKSQPPGSNKISIGHRPFRGRCPTHHLTPTYTHIGATGTADHLTLLRLFLIYWYLNISCNVKWNNEVSRCFRVPLGIKQGGINSPEFYGCYIDNIAAILPNSQTGCHFLGIFLAIILFADDICLMAPTRKALDKMIQILALYCKEYGLTFNAGKSKIVVFSKENIDYDTLCPILRSRH